MVVKRLEAFLGSIASANPDCPKTLSPISSEASRRADLPTRHPAALARHFQSPGRLAYCVPPSLKPSGTGILTCCPSTTPFGLALGSD